jgi:hypothetical protein
VDSSLQRSRAARHSSNIKILSLFKNFDDNSVLF